MEALCVHGPGDIQGDDVYLDDELVEFTVDAYALSARGKRLYDSAFLSRAKGRDKSGHAARLGLVEALGPCRFTGWATGGETYELLDFVYEYQPGEPMGRPVTYPFLRCMATEEGQTGNVYDAIYYNLTEGPLSQVRGIDPGITRTVLPDGGEIIPSTASSAAKDGGKETWVDFDETHLYVTPELRRMYATVRRNMAKRKQAEPWSAETSTMYAPGEDSVAERTYRLAEQIREGKVKRSRLLFDHREGQDVDPVHDDRKTIKAALVEAYGPAAAWMPLDRMVDEAKDPRNDPADWKRYFTNRRTTSKGMAVDAEVWANLTVSRPVADTERIGLGFDGSISQDATALIGCTEDGHLFVPTHRVDGEDRPTIWLRPERAGRDWRMPRLEIAAAVAAVFDRYEVGRMLCDPPKWQTEIERWGELHGEEVVLFFDTNQPKRMSGACDRFATALAERAVTHDGDSLLTAHVLAMVRRKAYVKAEDESDGRTRWVFTKGDDGRKIDAGVGAVLALEAAMTMPEPEPVQGFLAAWA
jgi:phage terminase large subunit-like protein